MFPAYTDYSNGTSYPIPVKERADFPVKCTGAWIEPYVNREIGLFS